MTRTRFTALLAPLGLACGMIVVHAMNAPPLVLKLVWAVVVIVGLHLVVGDDRVRAAFITMSGTHKPVEQLHRDDGALSEGTSLRPTSAAQDLLLKRLAVFDLLPETTALLVTAVRNGSWCTSVEDAEAYFTRYSHETIVEELVELGLGKHQSRTVARLGVEAFATAGEPTVRCSPRTLCTARFTALLCRPSLTDQPHLLFLVCAVQAGGWPRAATSSGRSG